MSPGQSKGSTVAVACASPFLRSCASRAVLAPDSSIRKTDTLCIQSYSSVNMGLSSLLPRGRPPSTSSNGRYSTTSRVWIAVIAVACIHLVCYQAASPLRLQQQQQQQLIQPLNVAHHAKRWVLDASESVPVQPPQQPPNEAEGGALLHWQRYWHDATREQKPLLFLGMILWLFFLFAFVGITASDFFCPNLSTIASRLGMSESVVSSSHNHPEDNSMLCSCLPGVINGIVLSSKDC